MPRAIHAQPRRSRRLVALAALLLAAGACTPAPRSVAPAAPTPDPRLGLSTPEAIAREGAPGAPVDCTIDVANQGDQALARGVVACQLLDADGVPVGTGLGAVKDLPSGQSRSVKIVVFGVRRFATARALVTTANFR